MFVDEVLAGVGIPILHVRWQRRYDTQVLATQLATYLGLPQLVPPAPAPIHAQRTLPALPVPQPAPELPAPCRIPFL
jgi:hypothetical protein